ncbi:MAG: tetratricopeptide repeat protein, partial [Thermonemataceae bacterium]|nr:tetratricopeptide repeat protein [Thermonemataceae bacterium]
LLFACQERSQLTPIQENTDTEALYAASSLQTLQSALEDDSEDAHVLYMLARWYYAKKDYPRTQELIEKAIKKEEKWQYYLLAALNKEKLAQYTQARAFWKRAYQLNNKALTVLMWGLRYAVEQNDEQLYTAIINTMQKSYTNEANLYYWQGKWAKNKADTSKAIYFYTKALAMDKSAVPVYLSMSELFNEYEQPKKALIWANQGLTFQNNKDSLLFQKAEAYRKLKEVDSAVTYYQKVYQLNPSMYEASYQIGLFYWKLGNYTKSLTYFENVYHYAPETHKVWYYLANCYDIQNKNDLALRFYQKAVEKEPENQSYRGALYLLKQKIEQIRLLKIQDSLMRIQKIEAQNDTE